MTSNCDEAPEKGKGPEYLAASAFAAFASSAARRDASTFSAASRFASVSATLACSCFSARAWGEEVGE